MKLMKAAKEVDFPEPVGPVHKIRPLSNLLKFINSSGKPISFHLGISSDKILRVKHLLLFAM